MKKHFFYDRCQKRYLQDENVDNKKISKYLVEITTTTKKDYQTKEKKDRKLIKCLHRTSSDALKYSKHTHFVTM